MTIFEYLMVMVSIILGLSITQVLRGIGDELTESVRLTGMGGGTDMHVIDTLLGPRWVGACSSRCRAGSWSEISALARGDSSQSLSERRSEQAEQTRDQPRLGRFAGG